MSRGREAEAAVMLAARHYRKAARADVTKQATGMRKTATGWQHSKKASIDVKGALAGGRSICIEVKQHAGVNFPINESTITKAQRDALDVAVKMGGEVWLLVDLYDIGEAFIVEWTTVQKFLAAPYRASLSLCWLRAHGFVCKATGRGTDSYKIWWLDYSPHIGRAAAFLAEAAERAKSPIVDLEKPVEGTSEVAARRTAEECKAAVRNAIAAFKPKKKTGGWYR